jgi:hypothetical protein
MTTTQAPKRFDYRAYEENRPWRKSEYCISYPNWGDRGRMRGSRVMAPGTLHRPSCRFMAVDYRLNSSNAAQVYVEDKAAFLEILNTGRKTYKKGSGYSVANYKDYKICKVCCADVIKENQS